MGRDKLGVPERRRVKLGGESRNTGVLAAVLEKARAELVILYRRDRRRWPDGIDSGGDRWYGDGSGWTEERIKAALDPGVFEGRLRVSPKLVVAAGGKPWEAEGLSRRTWFRRRKAKREVGGG
jgi:hypothetical protein